MTLIYIDTNVYIDYFEDRRDKFRPLGEFAYQIFQRTLSCEFSIVFSGLLLKEILNHTKEQQLSALLHELKEKNKILETKATFEDKVKTRQIVKEKRTSFNDTLHAVIAQRMDAEFLVTRNIQDFLELQEMVKILLPEYL